MRFFRSFLPNLTISLNLVLMIVIYLDMRNPMMGFLIGTPFVVLVASCCICSIAFRPSGVAALSRPSILAAIFMKMLPVTG